MALILPEISLLKSLEGLISWMRADFDKWVDAGFEDKSYLYRLFGGLTHGNFDYFEQAKKVFMASELDQRRLAVRVFFDFKRAHLPTVHITMPGEENDPNGLGYNDDGERLEREYNVKFSLIITSDNYTEVLIIYYALRALIMSGFMTLEGAGLRKIVLGGGDLQLQGETIPKNIYNRALIIDTMYDDHFPRFDFDKDALINDVRLNSKLIIK